MAFVANQSYYPIFNTINFTDSDQNGSIFLPDPSLDNHPSRLLVEQLAIYMTLIVSVIGIIGNGVTVIVLNQRTMRKWRSSILLSALAVVDFLYLLIIFLSIIDSLTLVIGLYSSIILCQATVYITHVCSFLSAAFTLSFTLQRFVAVLFPLHAKMIISNRSSIINIVLLITVSCSFYSFSFFFTNISQGHCREDERYPALFPLLIIDICLTFVLPFIIIVVCNIAIVYKLNARKNFANRFGGSVANLSYRRQSSDYYHERQRLYPSNDSSTITDGIQLRNGRKAANRKISSSCVDSLRSGNEYLSRVSHPRLSTPTVSYEYSTSPPPTLGHRQTISQRTTKMLVICSTAFLIFNSPYCAVLFYSVISKHVLTRTLDILRYFYFVSFCLNFFLYSLCGNRFRHELIVLLRKGSRKCCTKNFREHWLSVDKIPQQSSFSRVPARAGV